MRCMRNFIMWVFASVGWYLLFMNSLYTCRPLMRLGLCSLIRCDEPERCVSVGMESNISSDLQVILPSVGQTGSTSVHHALQEMGYRSFHAEERAQHMPGFSVDGIPKEALARFISRCAVDAVHLEPTVDIFPAMLEVSPNAKVVLTWRDYPSWVRTTGDSGMNKDIGWGILKGLLLAGPANGLHFGFIYDALSGGELRRAYAEGAGFGLPGRLSVSLYLMWLLAGGQGYAPPGSDIYSRGVYKIWGQEESYLAQQDEVRRLAAGRLLEFDVKHHGFPELAEFLGREVPGGSNRPFPHPRSKSSFTNDVVFDNNLGLCLRVFAVVGTFNLLAFLAFRAAVLASMRPLRRWVSAAQTKGGKRA